MLICRSCLSREKKGAGASGLPVETTGLLVSNENPWRNTSPLLIFLLKDIPQKFEQLISIPSLDKSLCRGTSVKKVITMADVLHPVRDFTTYCTDMANINLHSESVLKSLTVRSLAGGNGNVNDRSVTAIPSAVIKGLMYPGGILKTVRILFKKCAGEILKTRRIPPRKIKKILNWAAIGSLPKKLKAVPGNAGTASAERSLTVGLIETLSSHYARRRGFWMPPSPPPSKGNGLSQRYQYNFCIGMGC